MFSRVHRCVALLAPLRSSSSSVANQHRSLSQGRLLVPHARSLSILSHEQSEQFHKDGYLVLPDFATSEQMDALRTQAELLIEGFDMEQHRSIFSTDRQEEKTDPAYFCASGHNVSFFLEEEALDDEGSLKQQKKHSVNKIGHGMHSVDPVFNKFAMKNRKIGDLLRDLSLNNPVGAQSMYIMKPPLIGGAVAPHRDNTFLYTEPLSTIGLWFAIEDATVDNGCMWTVPGSHTKPLRSFMERGDEPNSIQWRYVGATTEEEKAKVKAEIESEYSDSDFVPLEAKKGTCVVLHGSNCHMSHANKSDATRHAFTLHCVDGILPWSERNWIDTSEKKFPLFAMTDVSDA